MTIREAIATILAGYGSAKSQALTGHALAKVARHDFPDAVRAVIPEERYLIEGSAGQGQWAEVPWTAVFDRLITNTARQGFYIVYLFRSDLSGVYLSLNQGVTSIRDVYGADAKKSLMVRAADYRARLGSLPKSFDLAKSP
jgi:5-methylcytosine-specific restriction protein A